MHKTLLLVSLAINFTSQRWHFMWMEGKKTFFFLCLFFAELLFTQRQTYWHFINIYFFIGQRWKLWGTVYFYFLINQYLSYKADNFYWTTIFLIENIFQRVQNTIILIFFFCEFSLFALYWKKVSWICGISFEFLLLKNSSVIIREKCGQMN